jgi:hypothetical protein
MMKEKRMSVDISRRGFFRGAAAVLAAPAALSAFSSSAAAQRHPPEGAEELTAYHEAEIGGQVRGPHLWLRWSNETLTSYRAHHGQKYPYFFPLMGPASGLSLTAETALPWPHHRSLYFSVDHLNRANFWQEGLERGQIKSTGPVFAETTKRSAVIRDTCEWAVPGEPVMMTDERRFSIEVDLPRQWTIDVDIEWKAVVDAQVTRTNHALFSLRCATDIAPWGGGTLLSSEGVEGEEATFGKPARWMAFYGKRRPTNDGPMEGIALFEHPENPWNPCPWFTRDYGMISPMPFQWITEPWELAAGRSVRLRYKVVAFAGDPREAELERQYQSWIAAR